MGNLHYPRTRLYWYLELGFSFIHVNMNINIFYKLRKNVHFANNLEKDNKITDRFWKVRPLFDTLRSTCNYLNIESDLCIDVEKVTFEGKLNVKQYCKGTPCTWGIKIFALCDKSGFLYDFIIYQGATS